MNTVLFLAFETKATSFALPGEILIQSIYDRLVPYLEVYIEVDSNSVLKEHVY
jgi:hypothetical protein